MDTMRKLKVVIIFILWILLWRFTWQIAHQYSLMHQPLIQEGKINLQAIVQSISQVVSPGSEVLGDGAFQRFDLVYQLLQESYYDTEKLNTGNMLESAVKAFVDGINDPYTVYMDSSQNSGFQEELKWQMDFEWIGAVVSKKEYYVMIEEVIKWSPAYQAGLLPLDRIIFVDSGSVKDLNIDEAVSKIRWPKGTKVILTIERMHKDGTKDVFDQSVTRDKLSIPSVTSEIFTDGKKIGYINISIIGEETENLMKTAIASLKEAKVQGIILDLRGNGWWLLPVSAEIASHFLPKGKLIVTAKYTTFEDEVYTSQWYNDLTGIPLVVLVDGMTASAGEIIALAIKEWTDATLLGTKTFGKWSIQTMDEFTDGASLKYTIGMRYSPSGKNIDGTGITPDVTVEFDGELYMDKRIDNQLEKAKELLK